MNAGQHAHGLAEADSARFSLLLDIPPLRENLAEFVAVDLDPLAFHQHEPFGGAEQVLHLFWRQGLAIDDEPDVKIQQRLHAEFRRHLAAHRYRDFRPAPVSGIPPVGYTHDQAGLLVQRSIAEETIRLPWRPGQRMIDVS